MAAGLVVLLMMATGLLLVPGGAALAEPQANPDRPSVTCGGQWRWVHEDLPPGVESGNLLAIYADGAQRAVAGELVEGALHYVDFIAGPAELVEASDDVQGGRLLLVGWPFCDDVETTTTSTSTTTSTTVPETTTTVAPSTSEAPATVASLSVTVVAEPPDQPAEFQVVMYDRAAPENRWTSMLAHGETFRVPDLEPGVYTVEQFLPASLDGLVWEQVAESCSDGSPPGEIELTAGEAVECEFVDRLRTVPVETTAPPTTASPATTTEVAGVSGGSLPHTGASPVALGYLGSLVTAVGVSTVWAFRRRGRHERG